MDNEKKRCTDRALYRLSRGDLTARGMLAYLTEKTPRREPFPEETALEVVRELCARGLIDDKRFLRLVLEKADAALLGRRRLREELVKRKFSPKLIELSLSRERDETALAARLLTRENKTPLVSTPEGRKKTLDFLVRKGFDYSAAIAAIERVSDKEGKDPF